MKQELHKKCLDVLESQREFEKQSQLSIKKILKEKFQALDALEKVFSIYKMNSNDEYRYNKNLQRI